MTFNIYTSGPLKLVNTILNRKKSENGYICVLSVHGFSLSLIDDYFKLALENSIFNVPDGMPVAKYASYKYAKFVKRVYGPDLMVSLLQSINSHKGKKIFFLGGNNEVNKIISRKIKNLYPNVFICGFDSRYIKLGKIDKTLIKKINSNKPDIVFVGLGCPKQELWMYENYKKINSLLVGVGAAFDFFAETKKQAPKWMQENYLEWLFRLFQEPRRLFLRYFIFNTIFIFHCFKVLFFHFFNSLKSKFLKI